MSTLRRHWPLLAAVAIQSVLLLLIPLRQVRARAGGTDVTLGTVPVDPYDVLSGYYVTLRYEAELPAPEGAGGTAWVLLAPGEPAWRAVSCTSAAPAARGGAVAIRAEVERGVCRLPSASRFYIPEARRGEVDLAMRAAGGRALVDARVSDGGDLALLRLRVGDLVLAE
jgi:uncharacterized membrane-anchored protein